MYCPVSTWIFEVRDTFYIAYFGWILILPQPIFCVDSLRTAFTIDIFHQGCRLSSNSPTSTVRISGKSAGQWSLAGRHRFWSVFAAHVRDIESTISNMMFDSKESESSSFNINPTADPSHQVGCARLSTSENFPALALCAAMCGYELGWKHEQKLQSQLLHDWWFGI